MSRKDTKYVNNTYTEAVQTPSGMETVCVLVCVSVLYWSKVALDEMLASLVTPLPSVMVGKQPSDTR